MVMSDEQVTEIADELTVAYGMLKEDHDIEGALEVLRAVGLKLAPAVKRHRYGEDAP
jgi:hypothetical protein